jgi:2-polyprenyl-3-methyl-5-hydroxy-6-metoxy-1,4-benzoquinol methylase
LTIDRSEGWDEVAEQFIAARSGAGAALVRRWARDWLAPSSTIVDVGCGSGVPIAKALSEDGFQIYGIDASPKLITEFRRSVLGAQAVCEAAQDSRFFGLSFDAAVSVGLMFLLSADDQRVVLRRIADALKPGGRLLFSAPRAICTWQDSLTGRSSQSLGEDEYERTLRAGGLTLAGFHEDEGHSTYFEAVKTAATRVNRRPRRRLPD